MRCKWPDVVPCTSQISYDRPSARRKGEGKGRGREEGREGREGREEREEG